MSTFRRRVIVYSAQDVFLFELAPKDLLKLNMVEEINAEHSLTIVTTRNLEKEQRILTQDETGKWYEFVVTGGVQSRGGNTSKRYQCVWSLQHDFKLFGVDEYYDAEDNITAGMALGGILANTSRWGVGTVTVTTVGGADMVQTDGWTALSRLVSSWGGEIDADISVDASGVTSRRVNLVTQLGESVARRRFDYSKDMTQIDRKVDEAPIACRVRPYGKSENTIDNIKVKLTIEEVNNGHDYIQNDDVAMHMRFPDGAGGYEYPTINIEDSSIDDDELLMEWAESVLLEYTTPTITYEANVMQYEEAGTSAMGLALGDAVQCVDTAFFDGQPLRLESRVRRLERDLLSPRLTVIKIGNPKESFTSAMNSAISRVNDAVNNAYITTSEFLNNLLSNLNDDINATGGFAYVTDGEGIVTYDIAVDDPLVGYNSSSQTWASRVVQIKGGSIRIADTKRSGFAGINDWDWKTVFVSGHVASELVTAANIVTGYIGNASGGNYWNLDTGELRMVAALAKVGNQTLAQYIGDNLGLTQADVFNLLTENGTLQGLYMSNNDLYINASYIQTGSMSANLITSGKIQSANGKVYFDLTNNRLVCDMMVSTENNNSVTTSIGTVSQNGFTYKGSLTYFSDYVTGGIAIRPASSYSEYPEISSRQGRLRVRAATQQGGGTRDWGQTGLSITSDGYMCIYGQNYSMTDQVASGNSTSYLGRIVCHPRYSGSGSTYSGDGDIDIYGALNATFGTAKFSAIQVSGTKSRVAKTKNYSDRLLYAYETPSPMFGDVGSATIGEDGICIVQIDDVFSETARTDMAYQVFLQECGRGEAYVIDKRPTYFVVEGTPNLPFDWQVMAHQVGFETTRLEDKSRSSEFEIMGNIDLWPETAYDEDIYGVISSIESLYEEA